MMPILLRWNGITIPAWHAMYLLGALMAFCYLHFLNRKWNLQIRNEVVRGAYLSAYFGGYFGARLFSMVIEQSHLLKSATQLFKLLFSLGPMTFYGGLIGAIAASLLYLKTKGLKVKTVFDSGILAGFLALSIGRVGCFLNGDDFGIPIDIAANESPPWWSVTFPNHSIQVPRVPVQLFESLGVFFLVALISIIGKKYQSKNKGRLGIICINSYAIMRFFLEFLRGDARGWIISPGLSTSQGISIGIVGLTLTTYLAIKLGNRGQTRH